MESHTVILGGGCAGLAAAQTLRAAVVDPRHRITVVDHHSVFVNWSALNDCACGLLPEDAVAAPRKTLIPIGVDLLTAAISTVDSVRGEIATSAGMLKADYLLVALGAGAAAVASVASPSADSSCGTLLTEPHKSGIEGFDITEALAMGCCPYSLEGARTARL